MGISACGKSPLRFTKVTACVGRGWSMASMDRPLSSASQTLPPLMPTAGRVWRGPHTRSWPFIWEEHSITHNQALRHDWKAREHFNLRETGNLGASWCNCPHLAVKQFCVGLNETMFNCWIDTLCWLSSCAFSSCKYRKQGQPSNREQREWGVAVVNSHLRLNSHHHHLQAWQSQPEVPTGTEELPRPSVPAPGRSPSVPAWDGVWLQVTLLI